MGKLEEKKQDFDFTEKTLEKTLQRMTNTLEKDDTFTITFRNGKILHVKVLKVETTN